MGFRSASTSIVTTPDVLFGRRTKGTAFPYRKPTPQLIHSAHPPEASGAFAAVVRSGDGGKRADQPRAPGPSGWPYENSTTLPFGSRTPQ